MNQRLSGVLLYDGQPGSVNLSGPSQNVQEPHGLWVRCEAQGAPRPGPYQGYRKQIYNR